MALGSIVIDLLLKTGAFNNDAKLAERRMKELGKEARAAGAIIGVALAGALTAVGVQTRKLIQESQQITVLSRLSGEAAGKFQEWAVGAKSVGVEQDKLADILKDTQDKVGDFLQTGGGAMTDFFEQIAPKVGVTAEQFRKLGGSDALQLYVDSLQKANVSQAEMTFYMEAIASDSSKLVPLLKDNGDGFKYWADYAREAGAIMDDETLEATRRLDVEIAKMGISIDGLWKQSLPQLLPTLQEFAALLNSQSFRDGFGSIINGAVTAAQKLAELAVTTANVANFLGEEVAARLHGAAADDIVRLEQERDRILGALQKVGGGSTEDIWNAGRRVLGLPTTDELRARLGELHGLIEGYTPPKPFAPLAFDPASTGVLDAGSGNVRVDPKAADKAAAEAKKALAEAIRQAEASQKAFDETLMRGEEARIEWANRIEDATAAMQGPAAQAAVTYRRELANANAALAIGAINSDQYAEYVRALKYEMEQAGKSASDNADAMTVFAEQAQRNMQSWLGDSLYKGLSGSFDGIADAFSDMLKRMVAEMMASQILQFFMGNSATGQGGLFDLFGSGGWGYASGGYTGPGGRNQPAGVVHKGEVVWSQHDIARAGGVGVVESMRRGLRGYAAGGIVGGGSISAATPQMNVTINKGASEDKVSEPKSNGRGGFDIEVFVKTVVNKGFGDGSFDGAMGLYGNKRQGMR